MDINIHCPYCDSSSIGSRCCNANILNADRPAKHNEKSATSYDFTNLIEHPNSFSAKYTDFTLPDEVEKFIKHVADFKLRNRFNMFISENQKKHIEKVSKQYGVPMSDYVRKLVYRDFD